MVDKSIGNLIGNKRSNPMETSRDIVQLKVDYNGIVAELDYFFDRDQTLEKLISEIKRIYRRFVESQGEIYLQYVDGEEYVKLVADGCLLYAARKHEFLHIFVHEHDHTNDSPSYEPEKWTQQSDFSNGFNTKKSKSYFNRQTANGVDRWKSDSDAKDEPDALETPVNSKKRKITVVLKKTGGKPCYFYNSAVNCRNKACENDHQCLVCNSGHPLKKCSAAKSSREIRACLNWNTAEKCQKDLLCEHPHVCMICGEKHQVITCELNLYKQ